jgi:hypothetical protein
LRDALLTIVASPGADFPLVAKTAGTPPDLRGSYENIAYNTLVAVDFAKCAMKGDLRTELAARLEKFESGYLTKVNAVRTLELSKRIRTTACEK